MQTLVIEHDADATQRLDRFIKKYLPNLPLGSIYKMLRTGKIKVNGKKKDQTYRLELQDEIQFWFTDEEMEGYKDVILVKKPPHDNKEYLLLDVLYEDDVLMVVNKPAGINVHAGDHKTTESNLIDQVQDYLKGKYDSLTFRPALVHRIDRDTSGCVLIAKDKGVLEELLKSLQSHQIEKVYHTLVFGIFQEKKGTFRQRLLRIDNAKNEAKVRVDVAGQTAVTHYRVLSEGEIGSSNLGTQGMYYPLSLLECRIETGRTHQIRVHLSYNKCPIIGDKAYGDRQMNAIIRREFRIDRQLLHARSLSFVHPKTKKMCSIEAPYPDDFSKLL